VGKTTQRLQDSVGEAQARTDGFAASINGTVPSSTESLLTGFDRCFAVLILIELDRGVNLLLPTVSVSACHSILAGVYGAVGLFERG
jgi:hypothetical protein